MAGTNVNGASLINGGWIRDTSTFASYNPTTHEIIGEFPKFGHVYPAVEAAETAFQTWRHKSRIVRAEYFDKLAQLIKRDLDSLADLVCREAGKQINEARADVIEGLHMCQYVFGTARMPHGEVIDSEIADKDMFVRRKPKGVVAVITPWNFPFAIPLWMMGPTLVEGNTVVFKPSEDTPAVGQRLVELMVEAGFPPGVVNLIHGGAEVGQPLCEHPKVKVICFTGSYEVGLKLRKIAASQPGKIIAAEMGSKSAVIVCDDARMDLALNASIISAFKSAGQRCVSGGRILVHENIIDDFTNKFVEMAAHLKFGNPMDPNNFAGPIINQTAAKKILEYNELAKSEGARVYLHGERLTGPEHANGWFLKPFVYRINYSPNIRCIREEVFGPHVAIIPFKNLDEAIKIYNDTDYGLSVAVITEDYRKMRVVRENCDFGLGYCNLPCIGAEVHLPFGGVKKSGAGYSSASALIEAVTDKIAWTVNHSTEIVMAQGLQVKLS